MSVIRELLKWLKPYRWPMLAAALTGFMTSGSHLGLLMISAYLLAKAALHPSIAELQIAIVGVRFFGIVRGLFRYIERLLSHRLTFRIMNSVRVKVYQMIESRPPAEYHAQASGERLSGFMQGVEQLEHFYIRIIGPLITAGLMWIVSMIIFGIFDPVIPVIISIFFLMVSIVIPWLTYRLSKRSSGNTVQRRTELTINVLDWIGGQGEIRAGGVNSLYLKKLSDVSDNYIDAQKQTALISPVHESLSGLTMNLCVAAVLIYSMPLIRNGELPGLYLPVILIGIMAGFESFMHLPVAAQHWESVRLSGEQLLKIEPVSQDGRTRLLFRPNGTDWLFDNITFHYDSHLPPVFKDFSLSIRHKKTAIIGPSGCGKSTLSGLMLRLVDPDRGTILLGGANLMTIEQDELSSMISIGNQNAYMLNGTIRENILLGQPDACDNDIISAARTARIHDRIIQLPEGYDTPVGQYGYRLSGGERQRIILARAFIRRSDVLILDEPTAHLDPENEERIFDAVWKMNQYSKIIVITHQIAWLEPADHIIVLNDGKIIEQGNHHDLLDHAGYYSEWITDSNRLI